MKRDVQEKPEKDLEELKNKWSIMNSVITENKKCSWENQQWSN